MGLFAALLPAAGIAAPRGPQLTMGLVWTAMGGVCMVAPEVVSRMSFAREALPADGGEKQPLFRLMVQCFGAQAVMCGILLRTSRLDTRGYAIWALAIVPFFAFDALAWRKGLLTAAGALGDAAGNVVFLTASAVGAGWLRLKHQ